MTENGSTGRYSAKVLQASGMVAVQASCTPAHALTLMQDLITAKGCCTLDEYAKAIIERRAVYA